MTSAPQLLDWQKKVDCCEICSASSCKLIIEKIQHHEYVYCSKCYYELIDHVPKVRSRKSRDTGTCRDKGKGAKSRFHHSDGDTDVEETEDTEDSGVFIPELIPTTLGTDWKIPKYHIKKQRRRHRKDRM